MSLPITKYVHPTMEEIREIALYEDGVLYETDVKRDLVGYKLADMELDLKDGKFKYVKMTGKRRLGGSQGIVIPVSEIVIDANGHPDCYNGKIFLRSTNRSYSPKTLIWIYHHGYYPEAVYHLDGNSKNNRIENLTDSYEEYYKSKYKKDYIGELKCQQKA